MAKMDEKEKLISPLFVHLLSHLLDLFIPKTQPSLATILFLLPSKHYIKSNLGLYSFFFFS